MLDGAALTTVIETGADSETEEMPPAIAPPPVTPTAAVSQLIIIDASVPDGATLVSGIDPAIPVLTLQSGQDGIEQISTILQQYSNLDTVHIFSHGAAGSLQLGNTTLNNETLNSYQNELQQWGSHLTGSGDLLLYGCEVAQGEDGTTFIQEIARLTEADIAASDDLTGAADQGGDWELEQQTGTIESTPITAEQYGHTLVNSAPVLDDTKTPTLTSPINEDIGAPTNGSTTNSTLVSDLINTTPLVNFSDSDGNSAGMAITAVDSNVTLWYSTDGGTNWNQLSGTVSETSALLLSADANTRIYLQPDTDYNGTVSSAITFKAWDGTSGSAGSTGVESTAMTTTGIYDTPSLAYDVVISGDGNTAYVVAYSSGLQIIDISNTASPTLIGSYDTSGTAYNVAISSDGNTAYIADDDAGLQIIDISTPASPTLTGSYTTSEAQEVVISSDGNTAYVADGSSGLLIIDISTPASPTLTGSYDTSGNAYGVVISSDGNTAYIADGTSGLQIVDISTPASPTLTGSYNTSGIAYDIALSSDGSNAFIAGGSAGLQVIDVSIPASPTEIGSYDTSGTAHDISISSDGNTAYIADFSGGLAAINISTPASPALLSVYPTSDSAYGVAVSSSHAFLANSLVGLRILDIGDPAGSNSAFSSNSDSASLTVTAVNDAPTLTTNSTLTGESGTLKTITSSHLAATDVDDGSTELTYTVTSLPSNGTLKVVEQPILLTPGFDTFTQDDIDSNRVTYTHDGSTASSDSFTFSLADGGEDGAAAVTGTFNITLPSAPVLSSADSTIAYTEGDSATTLESAITVTDSDSSTLDRARITISAGYTSGDTLSYTNSGSDGNIEVSSYSSGVLTLTSSGATATVAQWQSALRAVQFSSTSDDPTTSAASRTITWEISDDGTNYSSSVSSTITITAVNDSPALTAGSISNSEDELESGISIDAASSNLLSNATDVDDDNSSLVVGTVNGSTGNVGSATSITLSYTDADGSAQTQSVDLTVNADGSYSIATFDLDALPVGGSATGSFSYQVKDDESALSSSATATITISGTNDDPTLTAGSISNSEDELESGISVNAAGSNLLTNATDVDDADSSLVIGTVNGSAGNVGSAVAVTLSYTDADGAAQTQSADLTVNADGSYSIAAFDLDALPVSVNATTTFTYQVKDDSDALSTEQTATITISGTNDAPSVAGSISATEDQLESGITVSAAATTLLSGDIDDVDSTLTIAQVNGSAANLGTPLATTLSYTDADGNPQTQNVDLTVNADGSYSIAAFDLDALPVGSSATGSFTYQLQDDSGATSASQSATLTITGTNEAPTLTAGSISTTEDELEAGISINAADSNLLTNAADTDDADSTLVVGTVNGNTGNVGTAVAVTLSYTDADGAAQTQSIDLTVNADGSYSITAFDLDALPAGSSATGSFSYQAEDDSGALSSTETATITLSGTNDDPTLTAGSMTDTEDGLESGISVDAASSNLLTNAADSDDVNSTLTISTMDGSSDNVGSATTVSLSYTDTDGVAQTQDISLTVHADGSYSIAAFDLDALPAGNSATATFSYQVQDDQGALSTAQSATITITGTNDTPVLAATDSITYVEDSPGEDHLQVAAPAIVLSDIDNSTLNSASITISSGLTSGDLLTFTNDDAGSYGNISGSYNSGTGQLLLTSASNSATVTQWQNALRAITYSTTNDDPTESSTSRTLSWQATDLTASGNVVTTTINVTAVNDAPVVAGSISATEDQLESGISATILTSSLLDGDADDDNSDLTISSVNGSTANVGTPLTIQLTYTDADSNSQQQDVTLTVNSDGSYTISSFDLDALPVGNSAGGTFSYQLQDDDGLTSAETTVSLTISGTNDDPELTAGSITATEDDLESTIVVDAASSNLLTNATDVDDADSSLVVGTVDGDSNNVGNPVTVTLGYTDADGVSQTQSVELTVNQDGSYQFSQFDLDALPSGQSATSFFSYQVKDDSGALSTEQTATITISGTNDAPVVTPIEITATETQLSAGVSNSSGYLLTTSTDADSQSSTLSVATVNGATGNVGSPVTITLSYTDPDGNPKAEDVNLTVNSDGSYSFAAHELAVLPSDNNATGSFTFQIIDGAGALSTTQTASITIFGTNAAPSLTAGSITASEDGLEVGITVDTATSNLLTNASDVDDLNSVLQIGSVNTAATNVGAPVTIALSYTDADGATQIQNVDLTVNADGSYTISPFDLDALPEGENASGTFTYTAKDDEGAESASQTATITITGTNDEPKVTGEINATEDALEAGISITAGSSLLSEDIDDANSTLTIAQINGSAANLGTPLTITLDYNDINGNPQTQDVTLTVQSNGNYTIDAFDLDQLPSGSSATGTFSYQLQDDSGALSNVENANLIISGTNDNPTLSAGSISADEDTLESGITVDAATSNLLDGATDIDDLTTTLTVGQVQGDTNNIGNAVVIPLSYTDADGNSATQNISLTVNSDGSYQIATLDFDALPEGATASGTFSYTVKDDEGGESDSQNATITISGTNDAPVVTGTISASEDQLENGITVDAASTTLLNSDIDDADATLTITQVNGSAANLGTAVTVTLNYTDADGAAQSQDVELTVNADGSYSIASFDFDALPAGSSATGTFSYQLQDDSGALSTEQNATLTITGTNDAPAVTGFITADEDALEAGITVSAASSTLLQSDIDDADSTLTVAQVNGSSANVGSPVTVTLNYLDIEGSTQTQDVALTINSDGGYSINAFDLDALPAGNSATGTFSYQLQDDSGATSAEQTVQLTITGTNDNPTVTAGSIAASEDQLETGFLIDSATSNLLSQATDADDLGTTLTITTVNGATGNVGTVTSTTLNYTDADGNAQTQDISLQVNSDGSYTVFNYDLDALPVGSSATGSFNYQVGDDGGGLSSEVTATITISGTNDKPTLLAGTISSTEEKLLSGITIGTDEANPLSGASDADHADSSLVVGTINGSSDNVGQPLTITLSYIGFEGTAETHDISLTLNADGSASIAPATIASLPDGVNATGSFSYQVMDGDGALSTEQTTQISIQGFNSPPTLSAATISIDEDQLESGVTVDSTASTLLSGAADTDDHADDLSIATVNGAAANVGSATPVTLNFTDANGDSQSQAIELQVNADGSYAITSFDLDALPAGSIASASWTYQVQDDYGERSDEQTATIQITGTNDGPDLVGGSITLSEDLLEQGITVDAAESGLASGATDIDHAGADVTIHTVNGLSGNVDQPITTTLFYSDKDGIDQTQDITLTIHADGGYTVNAFDLDALSAGSNAAATFRYQVVDALGASSSEEIATITISGTNDDPVITVETAFSLLEDTSFTQTLTATDVDSNELTWSIASNPLDGIVTLDGNSSYTYTPNRDFESLDLFNLQVTDEHNGDDNRRFRVTMIPVNDPPVLTNDTSLSIDDDTFARYGHGVYDTVIEMPISDVDIGSVEALALTGSDEGYSGNWQFSINNGTTWQNMGVLSDQNALLLPNSNDVRIRYLQQLDHMSGTFTLTARAWDTTSPSISKLVDYGKHYDLTQELSDPTGSISRETIELVAAAQVNPAPEPHTTTPTPYSFPLIPGDFSFVAPTTTVGEPYSTPLAYDFSTPIQISPIREGVVADNLAAVSLPQTVTGIDQRPLFLATNDDRLDSGQAASIGEPAAPLPQRDSTTPQPTTDLFSGEIASAAPATADTPSTANSSGQATQPSDSIASAESGIGQLPNQSASDTSNTAQQQTSESTATSSADGSSDASQAASLSDSTENITTAGTSGTGTGDSGSESESASNATSQDAPQETSASTDEGSGSTGGDTSSTSTQTESSDTPFDGQVAVLSPDEELETTATSQTMSTASASSDEDNTDSGSITETGTDETTTTTSSPDSTTSQEEQLTSATSDDIDSDSAQDSAAQTAPSEIQTDEQSSSDIAATTGVPTFNRINSIGY